MRQFDQKLWTLLSTYHIYCVYTVEFQDVAIDWELAYISHNRVDWSKLIFVTLETLFVTKIFLKELL